MKFFYILLTILLSSYGQLIMKWRLSLHSALPDSLMYKTIFLTKLIFSDAYIFSSFACAYIASLCWMAALKNMDLSVAYPFMSLSFVIVTMAAAFLFQEKIHVMSMFGLAFIVVGISLIGLSIGKG